jgi:hypothetical protein
VLQEDVFFDLTGQMLDKAGQVGRMTGFRKEMRGLDSFIGVNSTYKYKGTTYGTYNAANPFANDFVNPLTDYTAIDNALLQFVNLVHPETGVPILVTPKVIVATPFLETDLFRILRSTQVAKVDNQANANTIRTFSDTPPRVAQAFGEPVISTLLYYRMIASATDPKYPGLGYAAAKAKGTFFIGDPQQGHVYMQNWPLRVRQATPEEHMMIDRGLVASFFADERGVFAWVETRYAQRNTPT